MTAVSYSWQSENDGNLHSNEASSFLVGRRCLDKGLALDPQTTAARGSNNYNRYSTHASRSFGVCQRKGKHFSHPNPTRFNPVAMIAIGKTQFLLCALLHLHLHLAHGYSSGAPSSTCGSLLPGHGGTAQNKLSPAVPSPYTIQVHGGFVVENEREVTSE